MIYLLADIHANLSALQSVFLDMREGGYDQARDGVIILGDIVDYGMRPNQVIEFIADNFKTAVILEGNHENAVLTGADDKFYSDAGRRCSEYTREVLTKESVAFLEKLNSNASKEITVGQKRILLVHGSAEDCYWGRFDTEVDAEQYKEFHAVFSGHSHKRHFFTKYINDGNAAMRGKKAILFCNPGSVGQPRNHIAKAQYCFCDEALENFTFRAVKYDIEGEQKLYSGKTDVFYRDRLSKGV